MSVMTNCALYVWGPNPLTNRLLASHIESYSSKPPQCVVLAEKNSRVYFDSKSMLFCDCNTVDPLSYCRLTHGHGDPGSCDPGIVLMNVPPASDLLNEIKSFNIIGIFFASDSFELIDKGIQKVLAGEHWLSRKLLVRSLQSTRSALRLEHNGSAAPLLTLREQEIIKLVSAGMDNQAIADALFISPNTVKTHISNIYKKIDVTNRVQAIIWASDHAGQLISLPSDLTDLFRADELKDARTLG